MMKNIINTPNILIINHRFEETDLKYFKISEWAASTFNCVSSTFASILKKRSLFIHCKFRLCSQNRFLFASRWDVAKLFGIVGSLLRIWKKIFFTRLVKVFMMFTQYTWNFLCERIFSIVYGQCFWKWIWDYGFKMGYLKRSYRPI